MSRTRTIAWLVGVLLLPAGTVLAQPATEPATSPGTQPVLTIDQWLAKAQDAYAAGDFAASAQAYGEVVAANPNNVNASLGMADALVKSGDLIQAKQLYETCLKISSNDWRANYGLGTLYLQSSYFKMAKRYLEQALSLAPIQSRSTVLVNLAITQRGLYQLSDAIASARQALAIDPANMDARRVLVGLYMEAKRLDDAVGENRAAMDVVRRSLAEHPDDRRLVEQLLQAIGQDIDLLQRKLAEQTDDVATRLRLAESVEQQSLVGQQLAYHQILDMLKPAMEKTPDNQDLLLAHARLLYLVGRPSEAVTDLRKVLSTSPENGPARQLLAKIEPAAGSQPNR